MNYVFRAIRRKVSYGCEVSAFVENNRRMPSLTGEKSKGLLIWVTVSDICVTEVGKITFAMRPGLSRTQCFRSRFKPVGCIRLNHLLHPVKPFLYQTRYELKTGF
ncbi:hypothetical protein Hanom_Chr12g01141901 [Helianthus anomalus]